MALSLEERRKLSLEKLKEGIVKGNPGMAKAQTTGSIELGCPFTDIVNYVREGVIEVMRKYLEGEYFIPEVFACSEAVSEVYDIIEPHLERENVPFYGIIVVGCGSGEIEDFNEKVVVNLLKGMQFKVHDLGPDVPPEDFAKKVGEAKANVLVIWRDNYSSYSVTNLKRILEELNKYGLRGAVAILIGGLGFYPELADLTGGLGYAEDPAKAVHLINVLFFGKDYAKAPKSS